MTWEIFLMEALGFFLQLFPCILMCFLPFDRDKLVCGKRKLFTLLALGALLAAAVFPNLVHCADTESFFSFKLIADLYMLLVIILAVTAHVCLVRETMTKKLLVVYVVILYAVLIYWLSNRLEPVLTPLLGGWPGDVLLVYAPSYHVFYALSLVTLFPLAYLFMRRNMAAFLREIAPGRMKREFLYATVSTAAFLALMMYADMTTDVHKGLSSLIILFLALNQALLYWMLVTSAVNRSREENALRAVQAQKLQYDRICADMERAARLRHDMRHHWNYLYVLAQDGDLSGLKKYLAALTEQTGRRESEEFCENPTVNALLQYYVGLARDEKIACSVAARCGELDVLPEDLTVIIGNTLENAVASCRRAGWDASIAVAAGVLHGAFTFEVSNTCSGVNLAAGFRNTGDFLPAAAFLSTREGGGRGLTGVAELAAKYLGSASFKYDSGTRTFTTRVILNRV